MEMAMAVVALISAIAGLIPGLVAAVVAIVKLFKDKNAGEVWKTVMSIADAAMQAAEHSGKNGADKKEMAMEIIKASCKSQGIDIDNLVDQISVYIDETIRLYNDFKK